MRTNEFIDAMLQLGSLPLGLAERVLIATIATTAEGGECTLTNADLARILGVEIRSVQRALKRLTNAGLVIRNARGKSRTLSLSGRAFKPLSLPQKKRAVGAGETASPPPHSDLTPARKPEPAKAEPTKQKQQQKTGGDKPRRPSRDPSDPKWHPEQDTLSAAEKKRKRKLEENINHYLNDFISREKWAEWCAVKHDEHGSFSWNACERARHALIDLRNEGYCPNKLLEIAARHAWRGIWKNNEAKIGSSAPTPRTQRVGRGLIMNGVVVR